MLPLRKKSGKKGSEQETERKDNATPNALPASSSASSAAPAPPPPPPQGHGMSGAFGLFNRPEFRRAQHLSHGRHSTLSMRGLMPRLPPRLPPNLPPNLLPDDRRLGWRGATETAHDAKGDDIRGMGVGNVLGRLRELHAARRVATINRLLMALPFEQLDEMHQAVEAKHADDHSPVINMIRMLHSTRRPSVVRVTIIPKIPEGMEEKHFAGAGYLPGSALLTRLPPEETLVIRAQNSGDMYHMRAAMIVNPRCNLLIWNVTPDTRRQAQQMIELHDDLIAGGQHVYYTDAPQLPQEYKRSETSATRDIEKHFTQQTLFGALDGFDEALDDKRPDRLLTQEQQEIKRNIAVLKPRLGRIKDTPAFRMMTQIGRQEVASEMARRYGAYTEEEGRAFKRDLHEIGHFDQRRRYVIVNFRSTGHSQRPGANAPALDTGTEGMGQLIASVTRVLGRDVTVVPMGEEPAEMKGGPNLLNYWSWPSAPTRRKQLSLMRYLRDHFDVVGAIGMRSGVMDQLAFAGIRIISIDVSPHRLDGPLPNMKPSKGWDRGLKLEDVYGAAYGRVFIKHPRAEDTDKKIDNWRGAFHPKDEEAIDSSIAFYFGTGGAGPLNYRHASHPLMSGEMLPAMARLPPLAHMNAYDLHHYVHPYLGNLKAHRDEVKGGGSQLTKRLREVNLATPEIERKAHSYVTARLGAHRPLSIEWMADHQMTAVLEGRVHEQNPLGLAALREKLGIQLPPPDPELKVRDPSVDIYLMYQAFYETPYGRLT